MSTIGVNGPKPVRSAEGRGVFDRGLLFFFILFLLEEQKKKNNKYISFMYLIGAGGHAKVICDILSLRGIRVKGFIEDDPSKKSLWDIPVVSNTENYSKDCQPCIIAIGNNRIRKEVTTKISPRYERAIHPTAHVALSSRIAEGTVLMAGVIINTCASVDHDCHIGDFVHIAPGATLCGGITLEEGVFVGAGATILPNIKVGKWATIGGGAVVTADVAAGQTVVGCPAKALKKSRNA